MEEKMTVVPLHVNICAFHPASYIQNRSNTYCKGAKSVCKRPWRGDDNTAIWHYSLVNDVVSVSQA